jgi:hypothetical protein
MRGRVLLMAILVLLPLSSLAADLKGKWALSQSTLVYRVTHPLHKVAGKSVAAKGKGECGAKGCEFLVAVPVKTFDSGDGNRDSHMWQTVKAGTYPMVQVRISKLRGADAAQPKEVTVDAEVEFAGKKVALPGVQLAVLAWKKGEVRLKGVLPVSLKAFDIKAPSLLTVPIEDKVPVEMDLTWTRP